MLERCHSSWFPFAAAVMHVAPHLRNDMLREYARELYPWLCVWQRRFFLMEKCDELLADEVECSRLHRHLARLLCYGGTSYWPHLCTGWEVFATATYDGQATLGLCWVKP